MYIYLMMLALSLMLISCSDSQTINVRDGSEVSENEETSTRDTGSSTSSFSSRSSGSGLGGNKAPSPSSHWINSVAFQTIEAGSFKMGSPLSESNRNSNEAQVDVEITKSFAIMETEVTQRQWFNETTQNPSFFKESRFCSNNYEIVDGVKLCSNHPVEKVSWEDVQGFITKINTRLGLNGCNGRPTDPAGCYRLPTEAEWEYAVRGGTSTAYSFGSNSLGDYAWYRNNSGNTTHEVKQKQSNPKGLYDMHGNVWEWVQDKYSYKLPGGDDPLNNSGSDYVLRGGEWFSEASTVRSAFRYKAKPDFRNANIGFRLVKTL